MLRLNVIPVALVLSLFGHGIIEGASVSFKQYSKDRCCMPDKWEGNMAQLQGMVHQGKAQGATGIGTIHVDAKSERVMIDSTTTAEGIQTRVKLYIKGNTTWVAIPQSSYCLKQNLPYTIQNCIPDNAIFVQTRRYGKEAAGLVADVWKLHDVSETHDIMAELSVSVDGCYPITQSNMGDINGDKVLKLDEFSDLQEGIKDPSVFDLPSYCKSASYVKNLHMAEKALKVIKAFAFF